MKNDLCKEKRVPGSPLKVLVLQRENKSDHCLIGAHTRRECAAWCTLDHGRAELLMYMQNYAKLCALI